MQTLGILPGARPSPLVLAGWRFTGETEIYNLWPSTGDYLKLAVPQGKRVEGLILIKVPLI